MRLSALAYLLRASARNRLRTSLARLKKPVYAGALVVGLLYLALILYRPEGEAAPSPSEYLPIQRGFALLSAFLLAVLDAKWWLFGASTGTLAFTPAEIQLLFPAPLRRRDLILYRLVRVQFSMLVSAAFISLLLSRSSTRVLPVPLRIIGLWVLFATSFMHQMGVTLVRTAAAQRGRGLKRSVPALIVVGTAIALLAYSLAPAVASIHSLGDLSQGLTRIGDAMREPIPSVILAPFRWIIAPAYAESSHAWLLAIGPALGLLAFHYIWVLRADAVFEDAAVDASARRAARLRARATAVRPAAPANRAFVRLSPYGPAWSAIVWKNLTAAARGLKLTATIRFTFVLVATFSVARATGLQELNRAGPLWLIGVAALMAIVYLVLAGPLTIRNDLRSDLAHLPTLRTYPLAGRTIVFAEIMSSALTLTAMQVALGFLAFGILTGVPIRQRLGLLLAGLVIIPVVNVMSLTIQNAIALLVPAWVRIGGPLDSGQIAFEALGQRALGAIAALLALAIALAPGSFAGVAVAIVAGGSPPAVTIGIIIGLAISALEIALVVRWLGGRFERTDPLDTK